MPPTSELARRLERARGHIQLDWSPERAERNRRAQLRRKARRTAVRAAVLLLIVAGLGLAAKRAWLQRTRNAATLAASAPARSGPAAPSVPVPAWTQAGAELRFRDGSRATLLGPGSRLAPAEDSAGRTVVRLLGGGARFDVVHDPARLFRVEAQDAAVEVLGTRFSVERGAGGVHVAVEHGRVRVLFPGGSSELTDGQEGTFPGAPAPGSRITEGEKESGAPPRRHGSRVPAAQPGWRALAEEGHFERAYLALEHRPLSEVSDEPGELLIVADVARLSRHPARAVPPLRKIVDAHPDDPRAPLAAFTLGRVLLDDLGRPQLAAEAFARAQRLDPRGPMAEDALAREVEAWSRVGDLARARTRAEEYAGGYPNGRRLRSVRRYGGLD